MIDLAQPRDLVAYLLMALGLAFDLLGCIGLVRLPDVYNRLQAGTKCVTLGTFLLLLGVVVRFGFDAMGWKALLCVWFIAMTSPTAAHAIARAAHRAGVPLAPGSVLDRYREDGEARARTEPGAAGAEEPAP
ncbi:MAG: monovalent cation/proton antiporter, MnhG/PhaG subunit [Acidobacteria bacterium]|jgi:multicomponent Na+:H+ antiporter subunit G|nr:monovalent cation/proton antiporter, MnhG/PhaG subunit [Acidobacteriota bacterium]